MRIISVSSLKGDEILGKQIYDDNGRVLLNAGVKLTPFFINKLKEINIYSVYIDDELSKDVIIEDSVSEKTKQMSKHAVKNVMDKYIREGKTDNDGIFKSVDSIIEDMMLNKDVLLNVSEMRTSDNSIYTHCLNVCILATIIGMHLGYNRTKVRDLSVGAMLHDIGKIKLINDKKIASQFNNKEDLDKYIEEMHPKVGYDFLGEQNFCNSFSKVTVLMHHERMDGSGYPLKLKGKEINEMAKLVAICDVFDNMITGRDTGEPKMVYEAIEYLVSMSRSYFDYDMVKKFTANIAAFPAGSGVVLNSKEKCLVIRQNKEMPMRPVVRVVYDKYGSILSKPYEIDLLKELTIFITGTCEL